METSGGTRRRAPWTPTAIFGVVVVLLAAAVTIYDASGDDAPKEDDVELSDQATSDKVGSELAAGAPHDGKDSRRLPLDVSPSTNLADGQSVTVSGHGFPPDRALGVVMCVVPDAGGVAGVHNCQISPYTPVYSDAEGRFQVEHPVMRIVRAGGQEVDCAAPPPEGASFTCAVAVGAIDDYDQSGVFGVTFDPGLAPAPRPEIQVFPSEGLNDGDEVSVVLAHVAPGSEWHIDQCGTDDIEIVACVNFGTGWDQDQMAVADGDGFATLTLAVSRQPEMGFGPFDCTANGHRCFLEATGVGQLVSPDLSFVTVNQT